MRNLVRYHGSAARVVPNANNRQAIAGTGVVPVGISPTSLAGGTTGVPFGPVQFTVAASAPQVHWQISGGAAPAGMTISDSGSYSGTPGGPGVFNFTIRAFNGKGAVSIAMTHTIA